MGIFTKWMGECSNCWENPCICRENKSNCEQVTYNYTYPKNIKVYFPFIGDIIGNYDEEKQEATNEFLITEITDENEIKGYFIDNRDDGIICNWLGDYLKIAHALNKHEE